MRTLRLAGVIKAGEIVRLASRCGWCGRWRSSSDYLAAFLTKAKVSHGICDGCARKMEADPEYRGVTSTRPPENAA